ncbi:MAG TPA: hypothetical protein VFX50_16305 [Gemmatimonadales bacterium]|nr:hypothetical protein [Gemmatimonadales bacterium]
MRPRARAVLACLVAVGALASPAAAQRFRDPDDGKFDLSQHLAGASGFLPIPIIITEPAVGYGGGLLAAYFHGSIEEWSQRAGRFRPPSISVAGGFYTENGSWGVVAGHYGVWAGDRVRYLGALGYVSPNLAVYPAVLDGEPLDFNLRGVILVQQAKVRVAGDFFAGARYLYGGNTFEFDLDTTLAGVEPREQDVATGGLSFMLELDARDNVLSPKRGTRVQVTGAFYGTALGGDSTYQQVNLLAHQYVRPWRWLDVALRVDATASTDGAPFYARPFLRLRGLPALQYQGQQVALGEAELRVPIGARWSVVGFGGVGFTDNGREELLHETSTVGTGGAGFRYLLARRLGLQAGVDIAFGPDDPAIYLQVGHAWF